MKLKLELIENINLHQLYSYYAKIMFRDIDS